VAGSYQPTDVCPPSASCRSTCANAVYAHLGEETRQAAVERRQARRAVMRRLPSRKRSARPVIARRDCFRTVNGPAPDVAAPDRREPIVDVPQEAVQERVESAVMVVNAPRPRAATWPIYLLAMPAFVAIWSGWVDLGRLTGFGVVHPLPGIWDEFSLNTAITLPIGLETFAAYALYVWLSGSVPPRARSFAKGSALASLGLGAAGQVTYHLIMAPPGALWWITTVVSCLPVAVLGMGAALRHLVHADEAR
jgi:hypothetical protein